MSNDDIVWNILSILKGIYKTGYQDGRLGKKKSRRRAFSKKTKQAVLFVQGFRCRSCNGVLYVHEFDHIDGNKANNQTSNCQALCPNCHAKLTKFRRKQKK
jgi:5-methylcytosine-specific restriction endonuclease McrA